MFNISFLMVNEMNEAQLKSFLENQYGGKVADTLSFLNERLGKNEYQTLGEALIDLTREYPGLYGFMGNDSILYVNEYIEMKEESECESIQLSELPVLGTALLYPSLKRLVYEESGSTKRISVDTYRALIVEEIRRLMQVCHELDNKH